MWLFDKLKAVGKAIVDAVSSLNIFGRKSAPVKIEPLRYEHQKPIKHLVIPVAPKSPTNKEILRTVKVQQSEYATMEERPHWVNTCYNLFLCGDIGSPEQLKHELDGHRLVEQAKQYFTPQLEPRRIHARSI